MKWYYNSNNEPLTYFIEVYSSKPMRLCIVIEDLVGKKPLRVRPYTQYTNRKADINGYDKFYIRMPLSPVWSIISVFDEKTGNTDKDTNLKVKFKRLNLLKKINDIHLARPEIREFVKFAEWFSKNAGILSAGNSVYLSPDNKFRIEYVDSIKNSKGKIRTTPARIGADDGIIEIAANQFRTFPIPRRMAILFHELSHVYINNHPDNETEADLNALVLYLGLGYSPMEAHYTFTKVFARSANEDNIADYLKRYNAISDFIDNFYNRTENIRLNYY